MAKDVKIEILYYKSTTDVSLEFGLHGDCPLRILHSNCNSIEEFFKALKRAISRSEIILTVGGYSDEDYLPEFIACSISKKCITPDYRKQNIITKSKYPIPDGSVPLAPKSRLFGGFLIESGPQTIISLVDDRKIRLDIVNQFIVEYISEHHRVYNQPFGVKIGNDLPTENDAIIENNQSADDVVSEGNDIEASVEIHESNDTESNTDEEYTISNQDNFVIQNDLCDTKSDNSTVEESSSDYKNDSETADFSYESDMLVANDIRTDIEEQEPTFNDETDFVESEDDEDEDTEECETKSDIYYCDNYHAQRHCSRRKKRAVRIWCIILSLLVILSTAGGLYFYPRPNNNSVDFYKEFNDIYHSHGDDIASGFQKVKQHNNAVFTWLKFDDIDINHPVFSVVDASQNKYLNKLPDGKDDVRGTLYSEFVGSLTSSSENAVIYGNATDGGLLQNISNITSLLGKEFTAADARFLTTWQVFSVFTHSSANGYDYVNTSFENDEAYKEHLLALQNLSVGNFEKTIYGNEKLLIIVGITPNDKFVLVASLGSVRVLSVTNEIINSAIGNVSDPDSSYLTSSEDTSSEDEPDTGDHNDFYGDSPDIILPPPITNSSAPTTSDSSASKPSSSTAQSSNASLPSSSSDTSTTSSESSSSSVSSVDSSSDITSSVTSSTESASSEITSSEVTSTEPSTSNTPSSEVSSNVISTTPSSTVSSTSSEATSSEQPKPTVDPIYTWNVELSCIDNATGIKYTGSAVNIVAMIIEDEMSPTIDPPEALIAQAVVKYNWLLNNNGMNPNKAPSNALDPNPTPQAVQYATAAKGMVLMYGNTVAKTYCHAYSAGKTSSYSDVWGGSGYPYLQSVDCPVDEELKDFKTSTTYTADKIKELIKKLCNIDVSNMPKSEWLKPTQYDANGLYCLKIEIGGKEYKGKYVRDTLLAKSNTGVATIRSTAYEIVYNEDDDMFTVTCKGYGHGVGLSQRGAKAYAKQGWTCEQILLHFFPGTTLVKH